MTWYNDVDPFVCQWLRNLIEAGELPPGDVDERPIQEVTADDLRGYDRCHFFAGIGGWELALALAEWEWPVWTGSCPCQPFSVAGKGAGEADARHLWPAFHRLIAECRPSTVFGEQVGGPDGLQWLAGVRTDLEGSGYAVGAADLPASSVGAPHIRQRLWWVADAGCQRDERRREPGIVRAAADEAETGLRERERCGAPVGDSGADGRLANADGRRGRYNGERTSNGSVGGRARKAIGTGQVPEGLADANEPGRRTRRAQDQRRQAGRRINDGKRGAGLKETLTGWATPRVTTNGGHGSPERAADGKARLEDQVQGWPTPLATDGSKAPTNYGAGNPTLVGLTTGRGVSRQTATTGGRGALAPAFVRWLMGFPVEWGNCAPTATPSSRK